MRKNITKEIAKTCGVFEGAGITHFDVSINNDTGKKRRLHTRKGVVVNCFEDFFAVRWDKGEWKECFLYSDLRSGNFRLEGMKKKDMGHVERSCV